MPERRFDELVLNSIRYALSLLASEKLRYPNVVVTGGAALLLAEPRLSEVYSTGDVDLLLEFPTDIDEIFLTLTELERKRPDEIFTIATKGVAELAPLKRKDLLPVASFVLLNRKSVNSFSTFAATPRICWPN
jgi:hypothetical protein